MPQRKSSERSALIGLARRCQVVDRRAAGGHCLTASLELAFAARRRGIAVELVRWKVRDDIDFVDHWAVRLDSRHVLDTTRVQVDGSTRLVVHIDDYPANFIDCRHYPATLFLEHYALVRRIDQEALPSAFMLRMAGAMFRFDVMAAVRTFFPVRVVSLALEFGAAHVRVGRAAVLRRLQTRRDRLVERLN